MRRVSKRKLVPKIGILGGGQLARMLCLAAHPLGVECHVLSGNADDPAAQVTPYWQQGHLSDLTEFADRLDLLTFESEFFSVDLIPSTKAYVFPNLKCMSLFQDRLTQKKTLQRFSIPTADFFAVNELIDLEHVSKKFNKNFVLKKRLGGYDGNGTFIYKNLSSLELSSLDLSYGFIAEKLIHFKQECAVMVFRSRNGSVLHYPLVKVQSKDQRCDWVLGPILHKKLNSVLKKIFKMLAELNYVGALGIEFFDTGNELLVNELAPRVHNTGHYSQLALSFDQFQLHLMCGLGLELPRITQLNKAFGMINLIGTDDCEPSLEKTIPALHWYGKKTNREGRKMGHINAVGPSQSAVLRNLKFQRKKIKL